MIAFIEGRIEDKHPTGVVLLAGGIGYEIAISLSTYDRLPEPGASCRLLIYEHIREDAHLLFGFHQTSEKQVFLQLLSITGIGPRTALGILSGLSIRELVLAVAEGDVRRLSSVPGIGKKTAERIVLEMRDKLDQAALLEAVGNAQPTPTDNEAVRDAVLALVALGYKQPDALKRVRQAAASNPSMAVQDLIRMALSA